MDKWLHKCRPTYCEYLLPFLHCGKKGEGMIDVTKMNGMNITINSDLIETVEDTPDTVITLTTGRKIIVKRVDRR